MLGASKLTKYIKCEGCRKFATELYGQAQALLSEHKGRKKMGEEPEASCDITKCSMRQREQLNDLHVRSGSAHTES